MAEPTDEALVERLRSELPVCPFDRRSPDYWTTEDDKPCHVCGTTQEGPDKCRGADTRCMSEAADRITALSEQVARLEGELKEARPIIARAWDRALTPRVDEPVEPLGYVEAGREALRREE